MANPENEGLFANTVLELHRGDLIDTLNDELAEVVAACRETGKKGTLTLTLTVTSAQGSDQVAVGAQVKSAPPKPTRLETLFYADGGQLVREDPRQTRLELRTVEADDAPLRTAA